MRRSILNLGLLGLTAVMMGCAGGGGSGGGGGAQQDITVSISPKTVSVAGGGTQTITATILNPNNRGVTWTLSGSGCSGSACGTLGNYGGNNNQGWTAMYTAPLVVPSPATVTVKATSLDDASKSDTVTITITAPVVVVTVSPKTSTVILGATQQLTATVQGTTNTAVNWTTAGPGTVSNSGLYSAPATLTTPAIVTVTATSQADNTKSDSATITIPAVTLHITTQVSTVILGATQQFSATVGNATNVGVTWSLSGPGTLSSSGLYATPGMLATPATVTITATSVADPSKSDSATFTIPAVSVSVSPLHSELDGGQTQQFSAIVGNAISQSVTWSVSGLGSISTQGLYSAPAIVPSQTTATITATSVADPTKSGTATVTLIPISVTVSPTAVMVAITGKKQFSADVEATMNTAVTWSVSGSGCSGSACGVISSSGRFVAPSAVPSPSTVTVKATSVADPTKYGTVSVQIMPNGNFKLNGNYAMYFQGFDPAGQMFAIAGSIVADGNGNLTGGVYDQNGLGVTPGPFTVSGGTYTVGGDNRGVLTRSGGKVFRFAISDSGDRGYFIEWDDTGARGSGVLKKQTTADFLQSRITGDYAFGYAGSTYTGERQGIVGRFTMDSSGNMTQGAFDSIMAVGGHSRADNMTGSMLINGSTGGPGYGRGTMTLTIPEVGSLHAAFYMVDKSEMFCLSVDPIAFGVPLFSGTMLTQTSPPFMISSLNGPAVFHATGLHASMGLNNIMIGQWMANPDTATLTVEYAGNDAGSSIPSGNFTATYSIAVNGRGNFLPSTGGEFDYYLIAPNKAFLVSDDFDVMTGMIEPQTIPAGGFKNSSLSGDFFLGTIDRASPPVIDASGVENFDGTSVWTSMEDASMPGGNYSDLAGTASYNITSATTGRGTLSVSGGNDIVFYMVSPSKVYNFVLYQADRIAVSEQQ